MKKTKYFMLSYILVLLISTIIASITKSPLINNIACASTLSGYFLAFADIYLNFALESKKMIDNTKKQVKDFNQKAGEMLKINDIFIKKYEKIIEDKINGWQDKNKKEFYKNYKMLKKSTLKVKKCMIDKDGNFIDIENKFMNTCKKVSDFFFVCACIVFFFTLFFPSIIIYIEDLQNTITIYGWVVVMLNYYYTSESEEKVRIKIKKRKEGMTRIISAMDVAIKYINFISEEKENGQT